MKQSVIPDAPPAKAGKLLGSVKRCFADPGSLSNAGAQNAKIPDQQRTDARCAASGMTEAEMLAGDTLVIPCAPRRRTTLRRHGIGRFLKTPTRPDPDPLADVEFEENGAVKKRD